MSFVKVIITFFSNSTLMLVYNSWSTLEKSVHW